ncbi:MAG: ABC transporter permease, partial [Actinomycetaceae bacterium]
MTLTQSPPGPAATAPRAASAPPPRLDRWRDRLTNPVFLLGVLTSIVMFVLVVLPLLGLIGTTLTSSGIEAWGDVLTGRLADNLFWTPLRNSLLVGVGTAVGSTVLGCYMAWYVVMTNGPARGWIGVLSTLPFALPSFALALSWETVFRNDLIGGRVGILENLGLSVPDWLSWGAVPVTATLVAHYYSLTFILVAAGLATVNGDLTDAGEMAGASRARVARSIAIPIVMPSIISGGMLAFAEGVSNFAAPALLGLPVRFQTLSTRLYGAISTGETERGYVLALLLIGIAALILYTSNRVVGGRRSYATITGKGGRTSTIHLDRWRWPAAALAGTIALFTTVIPGLVLVLSSFATRTNDFAHGFTTHYWVGASDPTFAQGQRGILTNPQVLQAIGTTVLLGLAVALCATILGVAIGYVVTRLKGSPIVTGALAVLSFLPFLIPGVALGAAFIALFGSPIGPIPALYGTFAILVIAGAAYTLPFAAQSGRASIGQIATDVEEAATMTGAGLLRRLGRVVIPLSARGL